MTNQNNKSLFWTLDLHVFTVDSCVSSFVRPVHKYRWERHGLGLDSAGNAPLTVCIGDSHSFLGLAGLLMWALDLAGKFFCTMCGSHACVAAAGVWACLVGSPVQIAGSSSGRATHVSVTGCPSKCTDGF